MDMNERKKTFAFIGVGVVLVLLAVVTTPKRVTPDAFLDQGEPFFPEFSDPNAATTLEVIGFDEETGSAVPFKVTFRNGRWTIPSHHDHPADGKDRLAKTAAGVIGIKRDDFRTDNVADHEACGVIDPLDSSIPALKGRGQRITIKGENDVALADFIVGHAVEGRENVRFVRVPGQKRVYAAVMDLDISTTFSDWIEADLLQIERTDVTRALIRDYTINERTGQLNQRDEMAIEADGNVWQVNNQPENMEVDNTKMNQFLEKLDALTIVGVRPKPAGLTASLTRASDSLRIDTSELVSLQGAGYYFTRDGQLVSNEGELEFETSEGVVYNLRFGEIVYGRGLAVTAGSTDEKSADAPGENRYLFITTRFNAGRFPEPAQPANMNFQSLPDSVWTEEDKRNRDLFDAHGQWIAKQAERKKISDDLNARFARWYYVISAESFDALRLTRTDLLKEKQS
jgi:hypothetical protein